MVRLHGVGWFVRVGAAIMTQSFPSCKFSPPPFFLGNSNRAKGLRGTITALYPSSCQFLGP